MQHEGGLPVSFAQKESFKNEFVKGLAWNFNSEINFQEAVREAYRAYTLKGPPYELQQLLDECAQRQVSSSEEGATGTEIAAATLTAQDSDFE